MEPENALPKIVFVLDRLRSAHNVGNIFRIAEAVGAAEIICCGYTPAPPHPKLEKTAMGADRMVPCRTFPASLDAVRALRAEGFAQIVAAEPGSDSPDAWDVDYRFPLAIVFGNEALGVEENTLKEVDFCVGLPMFGKKASINVGNSCAAIVYAVAANCRKKGCLK